MDRTETSEDHGKHPVEDTNGQEELVLVSEETDK